MHNHTAADYVCPICLAVKGIENSDTWIKQADIFYRDDLVVGFISSKFVKGNEGHSLIVPSQHSENLYDLPADVAARIMQVAQKVALALKQTRLCDGITVVQNNEPAGDQHAFHYHMHLFPRFAGDHFHEELMRSRVSEPSERTGFAEALRGKFGVVERVL